MIEERNNQIEERFNPCDDHTLEAYENGVQTFGILQQTCEGHNLVAQNLLREQPTHAGDINVVQWCIDLLELQCGEPKYLKSMQNENLELVSANFDVLTEVLQGPCPGNQKLIAKSTAIGIVK